MGLVLAHRRREGTKERADVHWWAADRGGGKSPKGHWAMERHGRWEGGWRGHILAGGDGEMG